MTITSVKWEKRWRTKEEAEEAMKEILALITIKEYGEAHKRTRLLSRNLSEMINWMWEQEQEQVPNETLKKD